jgi:hypothetical protein
LLDSDLSDLWPSHYGECTAVVEAVVAELGGDLGPFSRDTVILAAMLAPLCDRDYVYGNGERKRAPMTRDSIKMLWKVWGRMLQIQQCPR